MDTPTTKKELAKAYSPDLEPKVAGQHLKRLIHSCSSLLKALKRLDILKLKKNSGKQKYLIYRHLGPP